jgi:hypothetical protein
MFPAITSCFHLVPHGCPNVRRAPRPGGGGGLGWCFVARPG